jgi:hypothetical protein
MLPKRIRILIGLWGEGEMWRRGAEKDGRSATQTVSMRHCHLC